MVLRCPRDDRSSRQLITFSPGRRPRLGHTPRVSTRKRANNVERGAWNPRNGAGGVRFRRVHDGVPMTAANPTVSVTESVRSTVELDARASRAADGELSARFQSDVIPLLEPLYEHAMRMTRNHADAEDLLQETMVNAYTGFRTFEQGGNFAAWLHRILINTYISCYRKQQRRPVQHPTADITDPRLAANTAYMASGLRSAEEQALDGLG